MQGLRITERLIFRTLTILIITLLINTVVNGQGPSFEQRLRHARKLANQGFHARAVELYSQLYKEQPQHNAVYVQYSQLLERMKRYDELLIMIDYRLATRKNNINLLGEKARVLYRSGKEIEAQAFWNKIIENDPDNEAVYRTVSQFQQVVRLQDEAIKTLLRGREHLNNPTTFSYALGNLHYQRRNYRMAVSEYLISIEKDRRLYATAERMINSFPPDSEVVAEVTNRLEDFIDKNPEDKDVKRLLSGFFIKNREYEKAFHSYDGLDDLTKSPGNNLLNYSDQLQNMGVYEFSILGYSHLLNKYPGNQYTARAKFGLARSYEESGFSDASSEMTPDSIRIDHRNRAALTYRNVISDHPGTPWVLEAYYRLGKISYDHLFDLDSAIDSYLNVRKLAPNSNIAWEAALRIGDCFRAKGDLEGSDRFYKILEKAGNQLQDLKFEARLRLIHNEYYKAKFGNAVQKANELYLEIPHENDLSNDILEVIMFFEDNSWRDHDVLKEFAAADLLIMMKKNSEAESALQYLYDSLKKHDLKDDILYKLALTKRELNNPEGSVKTFEKLISEFPGSIYIEKSLFKTGSIFEKELIDPGKAIEIYESFLRTYPGSIYLDEVRKRLRVLKNTG